MTPHKKSLGRLRVIAMATVSLLGGACLSGAHAFAEACSDATGKYDTALRAYASAKFQFPQDCSRAQEYFRGRRSQAESLMSLFDAAKQACGGSLGEEHGLPPEHLVSLLEHEAVSLETGCSIIGMQAPAGGPPPVAAEPVPATAAPIIIPPSPPQPAAALQPPAASAPAAAPPATASPSPAPATAAATPPVIAAPVQAETAPPATPSGLQSCAAQKTLSIAPGCNADFPQFVRGAACAAADNSVGLTLQTPGAEPTCCVTACAGSK